MTAILQNQKAHRTTLTGVERTFGKDEIIVSKTDPKGLITYANEVFVRLSGYSELELLGAPHTLIRHPAMPRCVFRFLWDTIASGREVFAYVVNRSQNGDHYWVFAHVTPTFDLRGQIVAYHSNRRSPDRDAIAKIEPVYRLLCEIESRHGTPREAWQASLPAMLQYLEKQRMSYDEFVFTL